jgi:hypothetical protein
VSAPETRDPRFVNTKDACWVRRAVTSDGRGLYAVEGSCQCPEFLLVPLAELAAVGIVGSADVVPAPFRPEPEGEFYSQNHHTYRLGHDLPEPGGVQ